MRERSEKKRLDRLAHPFGTGLARTAVGPEAELGEEVGVGGRSDRDDEVVAPPPRRGPGCGIFVVVVLLACHGGDG